MKTNKIHFFWILIFFFCSVTAFCEYVMDGEGSACLDPRNTYLTCYTLAHDSSMQSEFQFDNGTSGWRADTLGGGSVISYSGTTPNHIRGYVGLRCSSGQTAAVEYGPISVYNKTFSNSTHFDWDQLGFTVHFRGSATYNYALSGRFRVELYDAGSREVYPAIDLDTKGEFVKVGCPLSNDSPDNSWVSYAWQFSPPHSSWYKISKVRLIYEVPANAVVSQSEVQIDQIELFTFCFKPKEDVKEY